MDTADFTLRRKASCCPAIFQRLEERSDDLCGVYGSQNVWAERRRANTEGGLACTLPFSHRARVSTSTRAKPMSEQQESLEAQVERIRGAVNALADAMRAHAAASAHVLSQAYDEADEHARLHQSMAKRLHAPWLEAELALRHRSQELQASTFQQAYARIADMFADAVGAHGVTTPPDRWTALPAQDQTA